MLLSLAHKLFFLAGGKLFILIEVSLVDLGFVLALPEVDLVASDSVGRTICGSCAGFGVALGLRGCVRADGLR